MMLEDVFFPQMRMCFSHHGKGATCHAQGRQGFTECKT